MWGPYGHARDGAYAADGDNSGTKLGHRSGELCLSAVELVVHVWPLSMGKDRRSRSCSLKILLWGTNM